MSQLCRALMSKVPGQTRLHSTGWALLPGGQWEYKLSSKRNAFLMAGGDPRWLRPVGGGGLRRACPPPWVSRHLMADTPGCCAPTMATSRRCRTALKAVLVQLGGLGPVGSGAQPCRGSLPDEGVLGCPGFCGGGLQDSKIETCSLFSAGLPLSRAELVGKGKLGSPPHVP